MYMEMIVPNDIFTLPSHNPHCNLNYSYFPILMKDENTLLEALKVFKDYKIYPRRYFDPSLDTVDLNIGQGEYMMNSNDISKRILCLPMSLNVTKENIVIIKKCLDIVGGYRGIT